MPPIAFGYVRVSTDRQDLSVDAQTAAVERAALYHQFGPCEIIAEPDVSGALPFLARPKARAHIARLRELQEQGIETVLIVPKVDRLGRDTVDVSTTVTLLETLGCRVIFLDINVDTRTPMGRAFMQIAAVFAELELARIRERIQTALDQRRTDGMVTGTVPYGWNAEPTGEVKLNAAGAPIPLRRLVDNPAEQSWILWMLAGHRKGEHGYGYGKIAAELNRLGVPTKTGAGVEINMNKVKMLTHGKWHAGKVHKVLTNKTVCEWLERRNAQAIAA